MRVKIFVFVFKVPKSHLYRLVASMRNKIKFQREDLIVELYMKEHVKLTFRNIRFRDIQDKPIRMHESMINALIY